jgi:fructokinase
MLRFGGIEAGGSKFVCAVGSHPDDLEAVEFLTTTPRETLRKVVEFFQSRQPIEALGIGSFGPIDPNPKSATFGYIRSTPKLAWRNFNFASAMRDALDVRVAFDTDVNSAAVAEYRWGAAQGLETFLYVTVGTGIGGGAMVNGELLHGCQHPEMGHIRVPHNRELDPFPGNCPYHGDCLEGLIAAPALEARWGQPPHLLPLDHAAWDLLTRYLALGLTNWISTLSPEKVILGGGIMQRSELFPQLRARVGELLNGYIEPPDIVPPRLGARAGVLGAIVLAQQVCTPERPFAS